MALELGAGEQLGESGIVAGGEQRQAVQHAADRSATDRYRISLAGEARNPQLRLVDRLDEAEAAAAIGVTHAKQADRAELAVDDAGGFKRLGLRQRHAGGD